MYNKNGEWKKFTLQYGLDLRVSRGRGRIAGVIKTPLYQTFLINKLKLENNNGCVPSAHVLNSDWYLSFSIG